MILLVIDMQPKFKASNHGWLLRAVAREVRAAQSAGWGIMFLEYTRSGGGGGVTLRERTYRRLTKPVEGYDHAVTVHKERDDGSAAVLHAAENWCDRAGALHIAGGFRVVGVNTEACVASTVNGLSKAMPDMDITVVGGACNGQYARPDGGEAPNNDGLHRIVTGDRLGRGNVRVLAAV